MSSKQSAHRNPSSAAPTLGPKGEVHVDMAGRVFRLVPSFANLVAVEAETGQTVIDLARQLQANQLSLTAMATILAVASEPKLDASEAADLIDEAGLLSALQAVASFIASALNNGQVDQAGKTPGNAKVGKQRAGRRKAT